MTETHRQAIFDEATWLTLYASLCTEAEYLQIPTKDFLQHAQAIVGLFKGSSARLTSPGDRIHVGGLVTSER